MKAAYDHVPSREEQAEADAYWALRAYKKWVVRFVRGSGKREQTHTTYVSAENLERAKKTGLTAAALCGHTWTRRARAFVRLATYRDLGAERIST